MRSRGHLSSISTVAGDAANHLQAKMGPLCQEAGGPTINEPVYVSRIILFLPE